MFDFIIYGAMGLFGIMIIFVMIAKKRMDNGEPVAGWKRKQFLEEQQSGDALSNNDSSSAKSNAKKGKAKKKKDNDSIKDLIGLEDIRFGVFVKKKNEYSIIVSTDSVNFDLLNPSERGSIILGYQALFRVINFPVQVLGQAVRQDLRKEEKRFYENLKNVNPQTREYNEKVISNVKERSEQDFRIARRIYYVISYIYEPSKMGKLTPEQKERKIIETLYQQAAIVMKMLQRARIESDVLNSLEAIEVMKRALNRDRMLLHPIESVVEPGIEKVASYITADPTSFPGFDELVQDAEEAKQLV